MFVHALANVRPRLSEGLLNKIVGLLDATADRDGNGAQNGYRREHGFA